MLCIRFKLGRFLVWVSSWDPITGHCRLDHVGVDLFFMRRFTWDVDHFAEQPQRVIFVGELIQTDGGYVFLSEQIRNGVNKYRFTRCWYFQLEKTRPVFCVEHLDPSCTKSDVPSVNPDISISGTLCIFMGLFIRKLESRLISQNWYALLFKSFRFSTVDSEMDSYHTITKYIENFGTNKWRSFPLWANIF